jgi:hypothetical protein
LKPKVPAELAVANTEDRPIAMAVSVGTVSRPLPNRHLTMPSPRERAFEERRHIKLFLAARRTGE